MKTDEEMKKFERLPKWAKSEIIRLERDNSSLKDELKQFEGKEKTNVFYVDGLDYKPLRKNAQIRFMINDRDHFDVRIDEDSLYISSYGCVKVLPRASNCFNVKTER